MKILTVVAMLLLCANTQAQTRKCIGADGKVTYSDVVCDARSSSQSTINTNANTIDHSGLRRDAENMRQEKASADIEQRANLLRQSNPAECRFRFHKYGDEIGKARAQNAKEECIQNLARGTSNRTAADTSNEHLESTSQSRSRALDRAQAAENSRQDRAQATENSRKIEGAIDSLSRKIEDRTVTCKPRPYSKELDCK